MGESPPRHGKKAKPPAKPLLRALAGLLIGATASLWANAARAATELQLWHSLDGANGALVARIAE